jgi:hypothetical protein
MEDEFQVINGTQEQYRNLLESLVWKDIVRELECWKKGFDIELNGIADDAKSNNPSTASVLIHMGSISGMKKAVDYVMGLPEELLNRLEERANARRNQTDGSDIS